MASSSSKPPLPLSSIEQIYKELPKSPKPSPDDLKTLQDARSKLITNPNTRDHYTLNALIGTTSDGGSGNVFLAQYWPHDTKVLNNKKLNPHDLYCALKVINIESEAQGESVIEKVNKMRQLNQDNILNIADSFITDDPKFCVAIPLMDEGSLRCLMASCFTNGFPEDLVSIVLGQTLTGLDYLHQKGLQHKEINAGHIFHSSRTPSIKLAVFASIYEQNTSFRAQPSATQPDGTICQWAGPPEAYYNTLYDESSTKSDIWLVGITALELIFGGIRVAGRQELEDMISGIVNISTNAKKKKLKNKLGAIFKKMKKPLMKLMKKKSEEEVEGKNKYFVPSVTVNGGKVLSQAFVDMVAECLKEDIERRRSAGELLQHDFFKNAKDGNYFQNAVREAKRAAQN